MTFDVGKGHFESLRRVSCKYLTCTAVLLLQKQEIKVLQVIQSRARMVKANLHVPIYRPGEKVQSHRPIYTLHYNYLSADFFFWLCIAG